MRDLVEFVVRSLVSEPDSVRVEELERGRRRRCSKCTSPMATSAA